MDFPPKKEAAGMEEEGQQIHKIRITLTALNVEDLEKGECPP